MNQATRTALLSSLTTVLTEWLSDLVLDDMPATSASTAEWMALAALAVLSAIGDAQEIGDKETRDKERGIG